MILPGFGNCTQDYAAGLGVPANSLVRSLQVIVKPLPDCQPPLDNLLICGCASGKRVLSSYS